MADQPIDIEPKRKRAERRWSAMRTDRTRFRPHWRELARSHAASRALGTWRGRETRAEKHQKIVDGTRFLLRILQSGRWPGSRRQRVPGSC